MKLIQYDICIIGGGISGLYLANQLEDRFPQIRILLLEKNSYLGGRTRTVRFHGKQVVTGAGIGRWKKDVLLESLQRLAKPMQEIKPINTRICYEFEDPLSTLKYIQILKTKKEWIQQNRHKKTFQQFFSTFFPKKIYQKFCWSNGYTDFEKADIVDTLYDYGFEDNVPGANIFYVSWNAIIRFLRSRLQRTKILLQTEFLCFSPKNYNLFEIMVKNKSVTFFSKTICFAGSVEQYPYPLVRRQIGYNSFLRLYVLWNKRDPLHKGTTYVASSFQKRITLSPRIQMLSYSDNQSADRVNQFTKKDLESHSDLQIDAVQKFYWKRGTHFYRPLDPSFPSRDAFIQYAQNPEPGVFLVGEVISRNQGWTEGALESVMKILPQIEQQLK